MSKRPFSDVQEMNKALVENFNKVMNKDDVLLILGDVCSYGNHREAVRCLKEIKGKKVLIVGNHDKEPLTHKSFRNLFVDIRENELIREKNHSIFLSHYPMAEWDGYFKGIWHFYGHVHNSMQGAGFLMKLFPTACNVGVDVMNFKPKTAEEIIAYRIQEYKKNFYGPETNIICEGLIPTIDDRAGCKKSFMELAGY